MSDDEAPVVTVEKKRGRPASDKDKAVETKKRPRTSSPDASEAKKAVENGNVPAKRGRGRPKAPVKAAPKGSVQKKSSRGRGRPKTSRKTKSSSSESEDNSDGDEDEDEDTDE